MRSSHRHFVKAIGLRWLSLMLLVPIPWAERIWALPILKALAPSERYNRGHGRRHKRLTDWSGRWCCKRGAGCQGATWCWLSSDIRNPSRGDTENPSTSATLMPRLMPVRVLP